MRIQGFTLTRAENNIKMPQEAKLLAVTAVSAKEVVLWVELPDTTRREATRIFVLLAPNAVVISPVQYVGMVDVKGTVIFIYERI